MPSMRRTSVAFSPTESMPIRLGVFFEQAGVRHVPLHHRSACLLGGRGDGDAHPVGERKDLFYFPVSLASVRVPVVSVRTLEDVDVVVAGETFSLDYFIDQPVGGREARAARDIRTVVAVEVRDFLCLGIVQDEPGFDPFSYW